MTCDACQYLLKIKINIVKHFRYLLFDTFLLFKPPLHPYHLSQGSIFLMNCPQKVELETSNYLLQL